MKGVILNINPAAQIVDISHAMPSYDLLGGALTIAAAYSYFPPGTVHVVVVDPGVGTSRRPIVAETARHLFVAPDNGVLSLVFEREERITVRQITDESIFLKPVSATFQGRDLFAPVAAHLSKGRKSATLGPPSTIMYACRSRVRAWWGIPYWASCCAWTSLATWSPTFVPKISPTLSDRPEASLGGRQRRGAQSASRVRRGSTRRTVCHRGQHGIPGNRHPPRFRRNYWTRAKAAK